MVLLTGGNRGIGLHAAASLLAQGHRVAVADHGDDNLVELQRRHTSRLLLLRCDVTDEPAVRAAVEEVLARWGHIDVLVNNAAVAAFRTFADLDPDDLRRHLEVNLLGYVHFVRAVLPSMTARREGMIKNVGSTVGTTGAGALAAYAASKGALEGLTRTLALELEPSGVRVSLVYPPPTRTDATLPLGGARFLLADPRRVGRRLAARVLSPEPVVTLGARSFLLWHAARLFPRTTGRVLRRAGGG